MQRYNVVSVVHRLLETKLKEAKCIVDATCGNGNDTLFIAEKSSKAEIWAFDIQAKACEKTRKLLEANNLVDKVNIIHDSHERILKYVTIPIDVCVFNLGYLPGDKNGTATTTNSTLSALTSVLAMLNLEGIVSIAAYPGHSEGKMETEAVHNYLQTLDKKVFTVSSWVMINHAVSAPRVYFIEKVRGGRHEEYTSCKN